MGSMALEVAGRDAYAAAREGAAVVDRSEMGKLALTGPQAKALLGGQVTNDTEALEPGTGLYAAFLTAKGRMLGDLRVLDLGDELLLLCERVALQPLFGLLRRGSIGWDAELHKRTLARALLSVVGPDAARVAGVPELPDEEHANVPLEGGGAAIRTDLGVDLAVPADGAAAWLKRLAAAGAVTGDEALFEVLRVESGRPRFGVELEPEGVIPQEAGLNARAVSFTKGCYVGQETVARLHYKGKPNRHLRRLAAAEPFAAGTPLLVEGKEVGMVGSAVVSPEHGPIGLALVRREAEPGTVADAAGVPVRIDDVNTALPTAMG
jgi:tRNA-modifying protein YgfZ